MLQSKVSFSQWRVPCLCLPVKDALTILEKNSRMCMYCSLLMLLSLVSDVPLSHIFALYCSGSYLYIAHILKILHECLVNWLKLILILKFSRNLSLYQIFVGWMNFVNTSNCHRVGKMNTTLQVMTLFEVYIRTHGRNMGSIISQCLPGNKSVNMPFLLLIQPLEI